MNWQDVADVTTDDVLHLGGDEVQYSCWNNSAEIRQWIAQHPYGRNVDWSQPCLDVGVKWNGSAFLNSTTGTATCVFDHVFQVRKQEEEPFQTFSCLFASQESC